MAVLGSTSLTGCNSIPDFIAAGSLMLFQQTASPTSWTKQTTHNNKALRVVTGTAAPGGTTAFTSVFASRTPAGTINQVTAGGTVSVSGSNTGGSVGNTTLAESQIPSHSHPNGGGANFAYGYAPNPTNNVPAVLNGASNTGATGGSGAHAHPFTVPTWSGTASFTGQLHGHTYTGTAQDFDVQYVDIIIASKD